MSALKPPIGRRDHVRGNPDGPVLLVEFGDFQCPACGAAYPEMKALEEAFGDELGLVFRHFPIDGLHPQAALAAEAVEAAGAQGRFWEMHDLLFEHQDALALPYLEQYAAFLGLDLGRFRDHLRTEAHADKVRADLRSGAISGVNGTPTFFLNGTRHDGPHDFATLARAIARILGIEVRPGSPLFALDRD